MAKGRGLAQVGLRFVVCWGDKEGWEYDAGSTSVVSLRAAVYEGALEYIVKAAL